MKVLCEFPSQLLGEMSWGPASHGVIHELRMFLVADDHEETAPSLLYLVLVAKYEDECLGEVTYRVTSVYRFDADDRYGAKFELEKIDMADMLRPAFFLRLLEEAGYLPRLSSTGE